ncbi:hypothetical protein M404DRAFT_996309 [Pisolithus tinctorius Marx 270]|uniref:Uncharacterized protein n=1 Tax=Pisolithus tinctorius Marx 270 TaxID=870435 RepID=A0A0C3P7R5_PISTI|nr:hypothetical protein M404DRAFT_996309 [Pisolithus tinctorius Marx 270]
MPVYCLRVEWSWTKRVVPGSRAMKITITEAVRVSLPCQRTLQPEEFKYSTGMVWLDVCREACAEDEASYPLSTLCFNPERHS